MADTSFIVNGFSIVGDPNANTNASGGGELMIHDASSVFESDDIVLYQVANTLEDGTFTDDTVITGIIVYDNASDYYNDTALYEYSYTGDEDGVEIADGRNGMGDTYLNFDATELTSADSGAPVLDEMIVAPGVDIMNQLDTSSNIEIATNQDIDLDGDGVISPDEEADGTFSSTISGLAVICYAKGTLIETAGGPRYIEELHAGDLVSTLDAGPQPIRWIGATNVRGEGKNAPVLIKAGALANTRDLVVSPNHRMLVSGAMAELMFGACEVFVAAKYLVNGDTIVQLERDVVEYYHFLLDDHHIVFSEGCPSESLFPGRQSLDVISERSRAEIISLFPELEKDETAHNLSRYELRAFEAHLLTA